MVIQKNVSFTTKDESDVPLAIRETELLKLKPQLPPVIALSHIGHESGPLKQTSAAVKIKLRKKGTFIRRSHNPVMEGVKVILPLTKSEKNLNEIESTSKIEFLTINSLRNPREVDEIELKESLAQREIKTLDILENSNQLLDPPITENVLGSPKDQGVVSREVSLGANTQTRTNLSTSILKMEIVKAIELGQKLAKSLDEVANEIVTILFPKILQFENENIDSKEVCEILCIKKQTLSDWRSRSSSRKKDSLIDLEIRLSNGTVRFRRGDIYQLVNRIKAGGSL